MEYEDILLQELMETPGELYDLPEFKQDDLSLIHISEPTRPY